MSSRSTMRIGWVVGFLMGIAASANAQKLYSTMGWAAPGEVVYVWRSNLDGSDLEQLVLGNLLQGDYYGIALDVGAGKMYFTRRPGTPPGGTVYRANLDGSNLEVVHSDLNSAIHGIAVDPSAGKIYWSDIITERIQRANLDGSNVEDILLGDNTFGGPVPLGIALELTGEKLYWADGGSLRRSNLDGSGPEEIVSFPGVPVELAIHPTQGQVYWSDTAGIGNNLHSIWRADMDGENIERIFYGEGTPAGVALDVTAGKVYWVHGSGTPSVRRANLDGSGMEDIFFLPAPVGGWGIALDTTCQSRLYGDIFPDGGDGFVDMDDLLRVLQAYLEPLCCPAADLYPCGTGDEIIDLDDLIISLAEFAGGSICPDPCE